MSTKKYWALEQGANFAKELTGRANKYYEFLQESGIFGRLRRSYESYYGQAPGYDSSSVARGGGQGELSLLKVNHYRNLIQHTLVMTVSSRPAMECRATNSDYKSQSQTILGNAILEYYMRERRLERFLKSAVEYALVLNEGFLTLAWDTSLGRPYMVDPENGKQINEGDISFNVTGPLDVIRDPFKYSADQDWYAVRSFENKYNLIAKYPEYESEIENVKQNLGNRYEYATPVTRKLDSDDIPVYDFYHKRCDVMPEGKYAKVIGESVVVMEDVLPYKNVPVYKITPGDMLNTAFGYSSSFDLLSIQEVIDALYSTVVTNQTTFGVQNIMVPEGHNINVTQLSGGLNLLEYDPKLGKPEALNLTKTPPEIFNFIAGLERTMETISGVNSVARGNPEANLRSGSSLALIQSMAVQFSSGLQNSYAQLVEDVGTAVIEFLQAFSQSKRIASIAGISRRFMLKEFTAADISDINRVVVDVSNPLAKTVSGRLEIARDLIQNQLVTNTEQYIQVLSTGRLEPLIEGEQAELLTIRSENERLVEGQPVMAVATDSHAMHIKEHKTVIATPDARENPALVQATLMHINEHINLMRTTDPVLLQIIGEQPAPPMTNAEIGANAPQVVAPSIPEQAPKTQQARMPKPPQGSGQ